MSCGSGIRPARAEDIGAVAGLENLIFTSPWSGASLLSALGEGYLFAVAEQGENFAASRTAGQTGGKCEKPVEENAARVVGYAFLDVRCGGEAELLRIAVSPVCRGSGYAAALMEYLISGARTLGAEKMLLEVRASNSAAIGLYKKYGFVRDGVRRGYYRFPTEDAWLMSCAL